MKMGEFFQACLADAGVTTPEALTPAHGAQFLSVFRQVLRRLDNHAITRSMVNPWAFLPQNLWTSVQVLPVYYHADVVLLPLTRAALRKSGALWKGSSFPMKAEAAESALDSIEKNTPPAPPAEPGVIEMPPP